MKTFALIAILVGLCSCSKSQNNDDNSHIPPEDYNIKILFVDEAGNDASDGIDMKLVEENNGIEYYELLPENYSYHCHIDGEEVPLTYYLGDLKETPLQSIIDLKITKKKSDKVKTFCFRLKTTYAIRDWSSDRLYEFDYRFKIPALLGDRENSLKVTVKAKNLSDKIYEKVTFNDENLPHNKGNIFPICINNKSIN